MQSEKRNLGIKYLLPLPALLWMLWLYGSDQLMKPGVVEDDSLTRLCVHGGLVLFYYFSFTPLGKALFTMPQLAGLRLVRSSGAGEDAVIVFFVRSIFLVLIYLMPYLFSA